METLGDTAYSVADASIFNYFISKPLLLEWLSIFLLKQLVRLAFE